MDHVIIEAATSMQNISAQRGSVAGSTKLFQTLIVRGSVNFQGAVSLVLSVIQISRASTFKNEGTVLSTEHLI